MSMSESDGFFSRWSRRKVQARSGDAVPDPEPAEVPAARVAAPMPPKPTETPTPVAPVAAVPDANAPAPTPLSLDDVRALTPASDFSPFVARDVAPEVRNAAMKTLFSDPQFNVMDGLDIYIDDYTKPDPLPLALARKLTSAQFMKVFDAPEPTAEQRAQPQDVTAPVLPPAAGTEVPLAALPDTAAASTADPDQAAAVASDPPEPSAPPTPPHA